MFAVLTFLGILAGFLRPRITQVKLTPAAQNTEQAGAMVPNGALVAALSQLSANAGPAFGNWSQSLVPASLSATTYTGSQIVGGIILRFNPGAAFTDCSDTATNIVNAIPGAVPLQTFPLFLANLGSGLMTFATNTGISLTGTMTVGSAQCRLLIGQVTGSNAVTFTNCFAFNLGTGGTQATGLN